MRLTAICIGHPETLPGKRYRTGINKHPVAGSLSVSVEGLEGDAVCDRKHHGGPDQAVYVEGGISLDKWRAALGHAIEPGLFGENLIIDLLDNEAIAVGDRLTIQGLVLEVTSPRMPCATFSAKMGDPQFVKRYRQAERPGFYCRVLEPGIVAGGMPVTLEPFEGPRITMPEIMREYGRTISGRRLDAYLAAPVNQKLRASLQTGKVKF